MDDNSLFHKSNILYTLMATVLLFVFSSKHLYGNMMWAADTNTVQPFFWFDFLLVAIGFLLWVISLFKAKMMKLTFIYLLIINLFLYAFHFVMTHI